MKTYDTGKVQIGIRYQRPPPRMFTDEETVQKALLNKEHRRSNHWVLWIVWAIFAVISAISLVQSAQAGEVSLMAGTAWFGPADNGTYWTQNRPHNIELTKTAYALRYDTNKINGYGLAAQYTNFGTARSDAWAPGADAPNPGGYDPKTNTCVGTCLPDQRWVTETDTRSIALIVTKQLGDFNVGLGMHWAQIDTKATLIAYCYPKNPCTYYNYHSDAEWYPGAVFEVGYRYGPWLAKWQAWQLEGKGDFPSVFTGVTNTLMVGYSF